MTDSLNFGPEWIRNLSSDGNISASSSGGTKYQLAEFRYGREEMLALFEKGLRAPDPLSSFPTLYVDYAQLPLALIPMTEDENRLWQSRPAPPVATRGRGGSLERGRGRGRGGATFHQGYSRSSSTFDESIRPYERQSSGGWQERNGTVDGTEWTGVGSSPRKELGPRTMGPSGMDNWRRHRMEEESDGWRTSASNHRPDKWTRASSWREGDPAEERYERTIVAERPSRTSWHSGDGSHMGRTRRPWDMTSEDRLPEWATDNLHESGGSGSFDSSGAFHGNSADDEHGSRGVQKSASQHNIPPSNRVHTLHTSQSAHTLTHKAIVEKTEVGPPSERGEPFARADMKNLSSPSPPTERKKSPPVKEKEKAVTSKNEAINGNNEETKGPTKSNKPVPREESKEKSPNLPKSPTKEVPAEKKPPASPIKVQKNVNNIPSPEKVQQTPHSTNGLTTTAKPTTKTQPVTENSNFTKRNEDEFDRMQEVADDLVAKLMLDEETPNSNQKQNSSFNNISSIQSNDIKQQFSSQLQSNLLPNTGNSFINPKLLAGQQPQAPISSGQDKWYYRDPQGDVQGPFLASDMTDWYRAGYFSVTLLLKRQCDERFFTLGELVKLCMNAGTAPFTSSVRLPPVKSLDQTTLLGGVAPPKPPTGLEPPDTLQRLQHMQMQQSFQQQYIIRQAMALQALSQNEPTWAGLSVLQQRELVAQHILTQPAILPEPPYINPLAPQTVQPGNNPLMQMINQMQQANKLPPQPPKAETSQLPNSIPNQKLDPIQQLIQQMGGLQQPHSTSSAPPPGTQLPMPGLGSIPDLNHQPSQQQVTDDPIKNFLRQFSNQQLAPSQPAQPQPPVDSFWNQGSFPTPSQPWLTNPSPTPNNNTNSQPVSMWGNEVLTNIPQQRPTPQQTTPIQPDPSTTITNQPPTKPTSAATTTKDEQKKLQQKQEIEINQKKEEEEKRKNKKQDEEKKKKDLAEKEKRRKEQEIEKARLVKEAEEKRKEDQRKLELERKAKDELQKKDMERLKKVMEKAKREAEEKRQKELEDKRRLKEQRKAEEEARKKQEEDKKKAVEEEKKRKEQEKKVQEEQARRQQEALRKMQETQQQQRGSVAPWYQAGAAPGEVPGIPGTKIKPMTLAEIQKAEKERRVIELALQQQQAKAQALKEAQELQAAVEKSQMQLKWASKVAAMQPKKVKSLAEIQAEEQERLAKQAAEARLAQIKVKKETASPVQSVGIWESASQSLTWGQNAGAGFWDDTMQNIPPPQQQPPQKTSGVSKSTSAININQNSNKTQNKLSNNSTPTGKTKMKKQDEQQNVLKLFDSNGMELGNEFSSWCTKALGALNSDVHIPTFIGFLMEIESPYEVKDYVRTYLGEGNSSNDFARQFLERRSKAKQRNRAALQHTDDMCVPAPAVNPSNNITSEFQEVKGKAKKVKKSRMMKVDARILGFSVTAAQDRINVGDRDYGDNA